MKGSSEKLFQAAKQGDLSFIQSQNFDETTVDEDGANCLHYVCRGGNVEITKHLVEQKHFNVSKKTKFGSTAFHEAAASGSLDILKWLWSNTLVNIDDQDVSGATPLHLAALFGHLLVVQWIIDETSCDLMLKTNKGALCLHFAVVGGNLNATKIILTEIPRSINLQLTNGTTPAYLASQFGYLDILKYLVEKGANLNMKSFDGMSCVHAACQGGHLEVVKWLVKEQKCNANDRDLEGASCLHFAATNGRAKVVEWMVKQGGAKVTLDNLGGSPLHNAAELGHFEVIKALIDSGCDVNLTDNDGLTAAELADKCKHLSCAAFIRGELDIKDQQSSVVIPDNTVVNSNGNNIQTEFHYSSYRSNQSDVHVPTNKIDDLTQSTYTNQLNTSINNHVSVDTFEPHKTIPHDITEQESTEYILPERDYPEDDDDSLSSTGSFIINPPQNDNYKSHQLNPENYEPPALPPETVSENDSIESGSVKSQTEDTELSIYRSNSVKYTQETGKFKLKEESRTGPLQESDLSSDTSSLSSTSRHNDVNRSKASDSSVHFATEADIINSPAHSAKHTPSSSPNRLAPSPKRVSPGLRTDGTKPSQVKFDIDSNAQEKRTVQQLRDSLQNSKEFQVSISNNIPKPPPFPDLGLLEGHKTVTSAIPPSYRHTSATPFIGKGAEMSETIVKKTNLLSELKQLHVSKSGTNSEENGLSDDESSSTENHERSNGNSDQKRPVSMTNGDTSLRPHQMSTSSSTGSLSSLGHHSPVINKNFDLVEELKQKDLSDLRVIKKPGEAKQVKMVFSFGDPSPKNPTIPNSGEPVKSVDSSHKDSKSKSPTLLGEYDPKHYINKVPDVDSAGIPYPAWKKQLLARQLAEKALKDAEEKRKDEEYEARFKNMPAWKRQMIERKESQSKPTKK